MASPTAIRTVASMSPEERQAAIVADVVAKVEPHFDARDRKIIEVATKNALAEFEALHRPIAKAHGWRAAALATVGGIGIGILIMGAIGSQQNRLAAEAVGYGTVIARAEDDQRTLSDDKGYARGREPASAPR